MGIFRKKPITEEPTWAPSWNYYFEKDREEMAARGIDAETLYSNWMVPPARYSISVLSKARSLSPLSTLPIAEAPRSFEIWKDKGEIKIVITGESDAILVPYKLAYPDLEIEPLEEVEPSWMRELSDKEPPVCFTIEMTHSLPWGVFAIDPALPDMLVAAISAMKSECWVQIVFDRYRSVSWDIETVANAIHSYIQTIKAGVPVAIPFEGVKTLPFKPEAITPIATRFGPDLVGEWMERSHQKNWCRVHIRGIVRKDAGSLSQQLVSVFTAGIQCSTDVVGVWHVTDPLAKWWFRLRMLPNPELFLKMLAPPMDPHSKEGKEIRKKIKVFAYGPHGVSPWGSGRELVPCQFIPSDELPPLISLPLPHLVPPKKKEKGKWAVELGEKIG